MYILNNHNFKCDFPTLNVFTFLFQKKKMTKKPKSKKSQPSPDSKATVTLHVFSDMLPAPIFHTGGSGATTASLKGKLFCCFRV